nr:MAG TPA: hypothetical protein [Bacteriophage sp.]
MPASFVDIIAIALDTLLYAFPRSLTSFSV